MALLVAFLLLALAAPRVNSFTVAGPADFSARCNATLALLNTAQVSACAQVQQYLLTVVNNFNTNPTGAPSQIASYCAPTSPILQCTPSVLSQASAGLHGDCAYEMANSDPNGAFNNYARSILYAGVYLNILCETDGANFCLPDFLPTYHTWPSMYLINVGAELGVFSPAAGNVSMALVNASSFYLCSTCSVKEYNMVFAFAQNVLTHSGVVATDHVGLPGNASTVDEQQSLKYITLLNTTAGGMCHAPFLTYPIDTIAPPAPTSSNITSQTPTSSKANATTSTSSSSSMTSTSATSSMSSMPTHSSASGVQKSALFTLMMGGMALLASMFL